MTAMPRELAHALTQPHPIFAEEIETLCAWVQDNWDEPDWKETYSWQERATLIAEAVQFASGKQSVDVTTHVRRSVINAIMRSDRLQRIIET